MKGTKKEKYNLIQYSYNDYKITNKKDVLVKEFKSRQSALNWLNKQKNETIQNRR